MMRERSTRRLQERLVLHRLFLRDLHSLPPLPLPLPRRIQKRVLPAKRLPPLPPLPPLLNDVKAPVKAPVEALAAARPRLLPENSSLRQTT